MTWGTQRLRLRPSYPLMSVCFKFLSFKSDFSTEKQNPQTLCRIRTIFCSKNKVLDSWGRDLQKLTPWKKQSRTKKVVWIASHLMWRSHESTRTSTSLFDRIAWWQRNFCQNWTDLIEILNPVSLKHKKVVLGHRMKPQCKSIPKIRS